MNPAEAETARIKIGAQQTELVRGLVAGGPAPFGFDATRLQVGAESLSRKRARSAAKAWPGLEKELSGRFAEYFAAYTGEIGLPGDGGPLADGREFIRWLESRRGLSEAVCLQTIAFDLRYRRTSQGPRLRRGFGWRCAWLAEFRLLVIAIRLPKLGARWWRIQFWRRG